MKKLTWILACLAILSACEEDYIPTNTFLELELSSTVANNSPVKKVILKVDQIIMLQNENDSIIYDSIPRSGKEVILNTSSFDRVWLGAYYIDEPRYVDHLEFLISEIALESDSGFVNYKVPGNWWTGLRDANLTPNNSDPVQVKLDLTLTQTLDSSNQKWIKPVFN